MARIRRCPHDGKWSFTSYRVALKLLRRLDEPGTVYWCGHAGGYHVTQLDQAEYDRRRAAVA